MCLVVSLAKVTVMEWTLVLWCSDVCTAFAVMLGNIIETCRCLIYWLVRGLSRRQKVEEAVLAPFEYLFFHIP